MIEDDKLPAILRDVLLEWESPEPNPAMDARIRAAWRASRPRLWNRVWTARVSVPVPVLAVLLLIAAFLAAKFGMSRSVPDAASEAGGYVTRLNASGFQPVPNGEARVITVKEAR